MNEYQRGYLDGYRDVTMPAGQPTIGDQEAERQTFAEATDHPADDQQASDYWIGYYHGRYHQEHGKPGAGAVTRNEIPDGL